MTRLTALELFGFKSFADRTRFEFPPGITVVVGPNGSGKSNVVDAIKWVLGEQSVRSLRGKEMTDVIFAGSAARKPLNMAEVSLCFDNTARELPAQTEEVRISRRVYRNGESEYLVNGEPARLRDIRELFSGTGAATEAYSVIEQGRVDALLVASGRDRRAVFEEAAGITRFRTRRGEALRRLERAEQNRQRLADIVGEVASRLETVRHQAARARRWRAMQDRLRIFRIAAAERDLAGVDASIATVEEALVAARSSLEEQESLAAAAADDVAALTAAAESLQPRLTVARSSAAADVQRAAAAEATASLTRQRRAEFETDEMRAQTQLEAAIRAERDAVTALDTARVAADTVAAAAVALEDRLAACERAAAGSHDDATSARAAFDAAATALDDLERRQVRLESEHERALARAAEAQAGADTARETIAAARRRHGLLGESRAACEGHLLSLEGRLAAAAIDVETLGAAQRDDAASLQKAWNDLAGWRAALEACRERRGMLEEIVSRQEGVSDAARRLLADGTARAVPGFAGVLADLLIAPVEWAAVVDLALGERGQSLVVESIDEAVRWHAEWSATDQSESVLAAGGRIGFLAVGQLREPEAFAPTPHPGIVGRLDRLLLDDPANNRSEEESTLVRRLFGHVWIVDRVEHALPLLPTAPAGTLFLTRSGVSLVADGDFAIGTPAASAGLVARRSELRALGERHADLQRAVASAQAAVDHLQQRMSAREADIAFAVTRRQQASETIASSRAELARVIGDERAAEEAIDALEREARQAEQRAAAAKAASEATRERLEVVGADVAAARADTDRCRGSIETVERSRGEAIEELHRLRIEQAKAAEKFARCRDSVTACTATREARRGDVGMAMNRVSEARCRLAVYDLDILAASGLHAETTWSAERSSALLAGLAAEADDLETRRRAGTLLIERARAASSRLSERTHALELEAGETRHQRARIVERIRDEYEIDIDAERPSVSEAPEGEIEPVPQDRAELESRIEELRRKLASMTTVNMEALQESEDLAVRLATLEGQLADVTGAKESIEQLITRIDDESRRLLGETIETVRGHFRDLFERVFGGGQADIVLEPGVDLLETSVEILARPPGKEPRSISLLSGGEKTMTCVALLLAIFKSRPSPFCVLDEVDAALDEANVDRFVGVLRDFLSSTQFIVVTHSKKTMASATTLYGVTQEESGVSKRVSVRFESAAVAARPATRAA
jgi:chromosome segregation protein